MSACNQLDSRTGLCDSGSASPWLCSGEGDCGTDGDDADSNPWNNEPGFGYAPYFINADDADQYYETVGAVTGSSAQVEVVTPYELDRFSVEYGTDSGYGDETVPLTAATGPIRATLAGLRPDTVYHYRITWTEDGVTRYGRDRTFRTARTTGNPFTFVITADTHWLDYSDYYDKMAGTLKPALESVGADFWVDLGDLIAADLGVYWTQDHANALYTRALRGINPIAHSLPFISVVGNHEMINQYYGADGCPFGAALLDIRCQDAAGIRYGQPLYAFQGNARTSFFPSYSHGIESLSPDFKTFFSWEWGDALCIALDPFLYTTEYPTRCDGVKPVFTLGEAQKTWLLNLLANDTHAWKFIFMHQHGGQPTDTQHILLGDHWEEECYGRGGAASVENSIEYHEWIQAASGYKNVIIFLGHDHVFSTGVHEHIRYFSCPMPQTDYNWAFDELGFRGEDWMYQEEATFSGTVAGIGMGLGTVYVKDYIFPPPASEIYKNFTGLLLRNYGQQGKPKRFQRYLKQIDPAKPSAGFDNGFSPTEYGGYVRVAKDGEKPDIGHSLKGWEVGDHVAVHRVASGVLRVDVSPQKVTVSMLDTRGRPMVFPNRYDRAGQEVKYTICSGELEADDRGLCDNRSTRSQPLQTEAIPFKKSSCAASCGCKGNFDNDPDVDGSDAATFKADFGRGLLHRRCITGDPCNGDFECDGDVDGTDAAVFKQDFGRNRYQNPCPKCPGP